MEVGPGSSRSLQPVQGGGAGGPGWSWARRCSSWDSGLFPHPSRPLITHAHWRRGSIFCFFHHCLCTVLCASQWMVSVSPRWGKRKQKRFSVISSASLVAPWGVLLGLVWGHAWGLLGECPRGAGPCGQRGSLIGRGGGKGCPVGWDPSPPPCERERGLSCLGFSEVGGGESLNGEMNKTLS